MSYPQFLHGNGVVNVHFKMHEHVLYSKFQYRASAEKIGSNADWKLALQKIDELQKTVSKQNERISILEKRHTESEVQTD